MRIVPSFFLVVTAGAAWVVASSACSSTSTDQPPVADASADGDTDDADDDVDITDYVDAGDSGYLDNRIAQIATGGHHTCAIAVDGYLWCWGANTAGELGVGTADSTVHPAALVPGLVDVESIALGLHHTCARTGDGGGNKVYCWGLNSENQLGHDNSLDGACTVDGAVVKCGLVPSTVKVAGVIFASIAAGRAHSLGITTRKEIYSWGSGAFGQIGRAADSTCTTPSGSVPCSATPAAIPDLLGATAIAAGGGQSYAIATSADGGAPGTWVWGANGRGELGVGAVDANPHPTPASNGATDDVRVGAGANHGCAARSDGSAACWGANDFGQLGLGADAGPKGDGGSLDGGAVNVVRPSAVDVSDVDGVALGGTHSCIVTRGRLVRCWGHNYWGQLGHDPALDPRAGDQPYAPSPAEVTSLATVAQIATGGDVTCAVKVDGTAWCWGANEKGQLGHDPALDPTCGGGSRCSFTPRAVGGVGTQPGGY